MIRSFQLVIIAVLNPTGTDRVDRNPIIRKRNGQSVRQRDNSAFRGRIAFRTRLTLQIASRGNINNPSISGPAHRRIPVNRQCPRGYEHRSKIGGKNPVELFDAGLH